MRLRHLVATTLLAAATPAVAQTLNVITGVTVKAQGNTVVMTVAGSKPPNFTTFSMADPPRFVIDLSEAKFQGVSEDMPVNDGTILVVKNLSYGSDQTSIARIMIAFAADVDPPDVETQGSSLVVTIQKPSAAGAAVAAAGAADAKAKADAQARADAEAAERAAAEKAQAEQRAKEQADAQARAEAEAGQKAAAEAREREAAATAVAAASAAAPSATAQREAEQAAAAEAAARSKAETEAEL
ncbi:MAG TPA: AMIN domain-containing protein, partial [Anaeromyxobacter sp.]